MSYKNGDAVTSEFCTQHPSTGAATNGDSLPVGTFARNGTDDGTVTVTVTNVDTGRYKAAFTIPAGAAAGDTCTLSIAATVNAIAGKGIVWQAVVDTSRLADVPAVNATKIGGTTQTGRDLGLSVLLSSGTGTGQLDVTSGVVKANLAQILGTALTETAGLIAAGFKQFFNVATPAGTLNVMPRVTLTDTLTTYTGNTLQTGDAYARLGAPAGASVSADVAAVQAKTTNLPAAPASTTNITAGTITTVTNLTNAPTAGDLTATMKTSVTTAASSATPALSAAGVQAIWDALTSALTTAGSIGKRITDFVTTLVYAAPPSAAPTAAQVRAEMDSNSTQLAKIGSPAGASVSADIAAVAAKTGNLPSDPADASDIATAFAAILTTAMTESYPADGATMTAAQALYLLRAFLTEMSISGVTLTAHKIDGSATAATFTLNDSVSPTAITRAS